MLLQARLGWAPPHGRFRFFAESILRESGSAEPLGRRWHHRFFKRWPQVKTVMSTGIDYQRLNGASRTNIEEFFARLRDPQLASIPPEHTWNMDEVGAQIALGDSPLVAGPSALKEVFTLDTSLGDWTTSLEAISVAGRALPPLVIFKGLSVQQQWFIT